MCVVVVLVLEFAYFLSEWSFGVFAGLFAGFEVFFDGFGDFVWCLADDGECAECVAGLVLDVDGCFDAFFEFADVFCFGDDAEYLFVVDEWCEEYFLCLVVFGVVCGEGVWYDALGESCFDAR